MELKETLLMPKTNFEMRGNLAQKEPVLVQKWSEDRVYQKMNECKDLEFVLHDGPPYANGAMHCGHMLNRVLKDFVIRYKNMSGFKTPFVFGWDTHGLPIENMVTKSGVNRKTTPIIEFREKCREYALTQVERQKQDIKRLGCLGDYDDPYITLKPEFEAREIEAFSTMALKGLIYKGLKPVYWSPSSESALAEAEIEYADVKAYTIFVKMHVKDGKGIVDNDASFVIWTTTPWTLPANVAIAVNPTADYCVVKNGDEGYVMAKAVFEIVKKAVGIETLEIVGNCVKGSELEEGGVAHHPFFERESKIITANYVILDDPESAGTGCVHTAPGHGRDDFEGCAKYKLPVIVPVDGRVVLTEEAGKFANLKYSEANPVILEHLKETGALLFAGHIKHSYPHCWRCHGPIIFRATKQWFVSVDSNDLRKKALEEIECLESTEEWREEK